MTYQNMTNNELCAKLTAKYRRRVETACTNAENIMDNISRTKAQANAKNVRKSGMAGARRATAVKQIPGFASAKRSAREPSFENFVSDGTYSYARAKAERARAWVAMNAPQGYGAQSYGDCYHEGNETSDFTFEEKTRNAKARLSLRGRLRDFFAKDANEETEKRVKTRTVSKGLVFGVALFTIMIMVTLFTYSSYTQVNSRVVELKQEKAELMVEREHLLSLLAVRDDIREIEDYATNVIGMVKSDYVETRYVSIADGERIEVLSADDSAADAPGFFSTLLSAMGGNWERVLEYID